MQAAIDAGLAVDEFAPRLAFFFNAHNNVFQEVAKFRAARRMWAQVDSDVISCMICNQRDPASARVLRADPLVRATGHQIADVRVGTSLWVFVNGTPYATARLVVVDGEYGIEIIEVVDQGSLVGALAA